MIVNEFISFQRGNDPKKILGIGQRHLIEQWLDKYKILDSCSINDDMTINTNRRIIIEEKIGKFAKLPDFIKFNISNGDFILAHNDLISLEGFPKIVLGYCTCGRNKVTSLIGSPEECKDFSCTGNLLTSLEGCPKIVHDTFWCDSNLKIFTESDVRKYCKVGGGIIK